MIDWSMERELIDEFLKGVLYGKFGLEDPKLLEVCALVVLFVHMTPDVRQRFKHS